MQILRNELFWWMAAAVGVVLVWNVLTAYAFRQKGASSPAVVYSGKDLGFRVLDGVRDTTVSGRGAVTGQFVVKIDRRWVEARPAHGVVPVTK